MRMIIGYLKKINFTPEDSVLVCQDYSSWRKDVDPLYKAQRKDFRESKEDEAFWTVIFKEINDFIPKMEMSLPWYMLKGWKWEADDWISVACRVYKDKEIIIVSSDRDLEQLCQFENVKIFSPMTKKYKIVPYPMKVLMEKIQGDISDNLLTKPKNEIEYEKRKQIVDLINPLPDYIEIPIKEKLGSLLPKNFYPNKVPYHTVREALIKLYEEK
jgi:5'-3' exonuclease